MLDALIFLKIRHLGMLLTFCNFANIGIYRYF